MVVPLFPDSISYLNVSLEPPSAPPCSPGLSLIPTWTLTGSIPACREESFPVAGTAPCLLPTLRYNSCGRGHFSLSGTFHVAGRT